MYKFRKSDAILQILQKWFEVFGVIFSFFFGGGGQKGAESTLNIDNEICNLQYSPYTASEQYRAFLDRRILDPTPLETNKRHLLSYSLQWNLVFAFVSRTIDPAENDEKEWANHYLSRCGAEPNNFGLWWGTVRSAKSRFDRRVVCERSLVGQHKGSVLFFWNDTGSGNEFVLTPLEKCKKLLIPS